MSSQNKNYAYYSKDKLLRRDERYGSKVHAQQTAYAAPKRPINTKTAVAAVLSFIILVFLVVVIIEILHSAGRQRKPGPPSNQTLGGSYPETAGKYFVDLYEVGMLGTLMQTIINGCTPTIFPTPSPIYDLIIQYPTAAQQVQSWTDYKNAVNGTGPGQCVFYGLEAMEARAQQLEGVADICHAYVIATYQYFASNTLTAAQINSLPVYVQIGVNSAFPLNMYFYKMLGGNWADAVSSQLTLAIQSFINGGSRGNVQQIAMSLCNPYFATDKVATYFNPAVQSFMAFPWEGLVNKMAETHIMPNFQNVLGQLAAPAGQTFKTVYIIDTPPMLATGGAPVPLLVDYQAGQTVSSVIGAILNSLYISSAAAGGGITINASLVPIMIFGQYAASPQAYQSVQVPPNTAFFAVTSDDPSGVLGGANIGVLLQDAISAASISVIDVTTQMAPDYALGPAFYPLHSVADFVNLMIGTYVYAGSTAAYGILDTFAMKNTLVTGADVGGWLDRTLAAADIANSGLATGMKRHAFAMELIEGVINPFETMTQTAAASPGPGSQSQSQSQTQSPPASGGSGFTLPASWDWTKVRPDCVVPTENQGICNCCWAISSTGAMSARLCINSAPGAFSSNDYFSIAQVVSCSTNLITNTDGCDAQFPSTPFTYLSGDITTSRCYPYSARGSTAPGCRSSCEDNSRPPLAGGIVPGSYNSLQNANAIKTEIMMNGPIAVGITIPANFLNFFPVYQPTPLSNVFPVSANMNFLSPGGHMVRCWGWDDTTNPPSWLIQNSWGTRQGQNGFIRLAQDVNGVLKGKVPWVDTHGYTAQVRKTPTSPINVISNQIPVTSTTAGPRVVPIYTATISCPNMVLNQNQTSKQQAILGCPNSAANISVMSSSAGAARAAPPSFTVAALAGFVLLTLSFMPVLQ
jgi:Papain family cysteine protease